MDPNLFHLDWERTLEALVMIIILSFLIERACALLFESRWWIFNFEDRRVRARSDQPNGGEGQAIQPPRPSAPSQPAQPATPGASAQPAQLTGGAGGTSRIRTRPRFPLKEILSFALAFAVCKSWQFDAVSIILLSAQVTVPGMIITAAVIAGGSKASIALFHNVMDVRSDASRELKTIKDAAKA